MSLSSPSGAELIEDSDSPNAAGTDPDLEHEDSEGVWSADIEQSFQEALALYPPCGRRKIIITEEGKMFGRNELIARYIKIRTGKARSRKQVSSHIQVLARKKTRDLSQRLKSMDMDPAAKDQVIASFSGLSSSQIVSANKAERRKEDMGMNSAGGMSSLHFRDRSDPSSLMTSSAANALSSNYLPLHDRMQSDVGFNGGQLGSLNGMGRSSQQQPEQPMVLQPTPLSAMTGWIKEPWHRGIVGSSRIQILEFSVFAEKVNPNDPDMVMQHHIMRLHGEPSPALEDIELREIEDKFSAFDPANKTAQQGPEPSSCNISSLVKHAKQNAAFYIIKFWGNIDSAILDDQQTTFYSHLRMESLEKIQVCQTISVSCFGQTAFEKTETLDVPTYQEGLFCHTMAKHQLCPFITTFIHKLKSLDEHHKMSKVLENFTILQVIRPADSSEVLLSIGYVFDVSSFSESQFNVYRLVD